MVADNEVTGASVYSHGPATVALKVSWARAMQIKDPVIAMKLGGGVFRSPESSTPCLSE